MPSPVSPQRWHRAQARILESWQGRNLEAERARTKARYLPVLQPIAEKLPEEPAVLELGSGPVCLSAELPHGRLILQDPLIEDYRRMFPGALPGDAETTPRPAEDLPLPDNSVDLVLSIHSLPDTLNPELALHEATRVLRPDGVMAVVIRTHPPLEARLHYLLERALPRLCHGMHPYFYAEQGIRRTLSRHLDLESGTQLGSLPGWIPGMRREEWLFVGSPRKRKGR